MCVTQSQALRCHRIDCPNKIPRGYYHKWALKGCATWQGLSFTSPTLEQGIKLTLSLWKMAMFWNWNRADFAPRVPDHNQVWLRNSAPYINTILMQADHFQKSVQNVFLFFLLSWTGSLFLQSLSWTWSTYLFLVWVLL